MEEEKPGCAIAVAFVIIILMIITCLVECGRQLLN
jgi:hypothetical protein|nr:MAG TPA: LRRC37A/B like protein 1 C-terminal domain [Crassvirales sp.]DAN01146.1 MAG TPA: LRRC37A/B like protein 1 C-terminal domain [Crassvirales sp.]